MSFRLDRYEPVAFHTHPELMRAADAQTAVLHPAAPSPAAAPLLRQSRPQCLSPWPGLRRCRRPPRCPRRPLWPRRPRRSPAAVSPPAPALAPPAPIAAYVVGMDATAVLRSSLADFLDAGGARRDVRVSVGVAAGAQVSWVLRDRVPYGVRAMPRYPETGPELDPDAALAATVAAVAADAAADPAPPAAGGAGLGPGAGARPPAGLADVRPSAALRRHGAHPTRDERDRGRRLDPGPVPSQGRSPRCWVMPVGCWTAGRRSPTRRPASGWAAGLGAAELSSPVWPSWAVVTGRDPQGGLAAWVESALDARQRVVPARRHHRGAAALLGQGRCVLPQASCQVPLLRFRPRASSRRRLSAATRWWSQALFLATPR